MDGPEAAGKKKKDQRLLVCGLHVGGRDVVVDGVAKDALRPTNIIIYYIGTRPRRINDDNRRKTTRVQLLLFSSSLSSSTRRFVINICT